MTDPQTIEQALAEALVNADTLNPDREHEPRHDAAAILATEPMQAITREAAVTDKWRTVAHVLAESIAYHRNRTRHDKASCLECKALAIYDAALEATDD